VFDFVHFVFRSPSGFPDAENRKNEVVFHDFFARLEIFFDLVSEKARSGKIPAPRRN
jgi:hypothetical protein